MIDAALAILPADKFQRFVSWQGRPPDAEVQIGLDEDGHQSFTIRQNLFGAAAQHHKGFPCGGVPAQQVELHLSHAVLRRAAEALDAAVEQGRAGTLVILFQRFGVYAPVLGGALQDALVVQRQTEPFCQRPGNFQTAAAGFPANGNDQLRHRCTSCKEKISASRP